MRPDFHHFCNLEVPEEDLADLIDILVKDEECVVLVVPGTVVIDEKFPFIIVFFQLFEVLLISQFGADVEDLAIDSVSERWRDTSFCELNEERLIVV